ncbi:MAG: hypothetical protein V2I97_09360 [Desulfococcaceae bacterium]|nr:hypothetical protein [Desulfococcaceae bacterium]
MFRHKLQNTQKLRMGIGVPCTLEISAGTGRPEIRITASPADMQQMDFIINENGKKETIVEIRSDQGGKKNLNCDISVYLPESPLEHLWIDTVCGKVNLGRLKVRKLDVSNVQGKYRMDSASQAKHFRLSMVNCESEIHLADTVETGKIKAVQSKTRLRAGSVSGIFDIHAVGSDTRINDIAIRNGHICKGREGENRKISCEIVSGSFFVEGIED